MNALSRREEAQGITEQAPSAMRLAPNMGHRTHGALRYWQGGA
jgi:hypothetical protein